MELDRSPPRLVLFGGPGAGKGWLARHLKTRFPECEQVGTGDHFRHLIADGHPLGEIARPHMESGGLIPDELVLEQMAAMLTVGRFSSGFVFDGFPRTRAQADALDALLASGGPGPLDAVLLVEVPDAVAVERLAGRLVCAACAEVFHRTGKPPRTEGVCDACGGALARRTDDDPDVVRNRLAVSQRQFSDVVGAYEARGLLLRLDGTRLTPATAEAVASAVHARRVRGPPSARLTAYRERTPRLWRTDG